MSRKQELINQIREIVEARPKLAKGFIQDGENPDLFHELHNGPLISRDECLNIPARRHLFFVWASKAALLARPMARPAQ